MESWKSSRRSPSGRVQTACRYFALLADQSENLVEKVVFAELPKKEKHELLMWLCGFVLDRFVVWCGWHWVRVVSWWLLLLLLAPRRCE